MEVILGVFGGLAALAMVSIYCALRLAKRTDDLVLRMEIQESLEEPVKVWYPSSVFEKAPRVSRVGRPKI